MQRSFRRLALCVLAALPLCGQTTPLLDILSSELDRNFQALKKADPAPYYLAYEVTDVQANSIAASLGAIQGRNDSHARILDVTVRVGSPKLDNYHSVRGDRGQFTSGATISLDDLAGPIRRQAWSETDRAYRAASRRLISITTDQQVRVADQDTSDDFSAEEKSVAVVKAPRFDFSPEEWVPRLRKWSASLGEHFGVLGSNISLSVQHEVKSFVSTEGTRLQHGRNFTRIMIVAQGKAVDGMDLGTMTSFEAADPSRLPKASVIEAAVEQAGKQLSALLNAEAAEPIATPAILSGRAAGVFFHEIFGHRIEGHRQKDESEGQTFTKMVDSKVLPDFLSITFDPTLRQIAGVDLNGWYDYDDEGIPARRVPLIENGVLKTFLMSRSPVKGFAKSNGHGRRQPGAEVVSRQSNLIVESHKAVPEARLREMLIAEVKKANKPYGLYFDQITGGYTTTGRRGLQAFKVIPLVVYRVFPDGRPDQLIRGVDIVGTPLASFARILATGDKPEVFNGYCGAESGSVPVSAVSPALLISELEIEKKEKSREQPPLLSKPAQGAAR